MNEQNVNAGQSLRGQFLIATPYLGDPQFQGGLIYLCEHSEEGALGLMVNRPLDVTLGDILNQLDIDSDEITAPVYSGGPVQMERGFVLHHPSASWQNTATVEDGVQLTTSRDILTAIAAAEGPGHYLVMLGYAGWGEGQLESELASNAWLTCPATPDLLFDTPWAQRYRAALKRIGVDLTQLSETVGHA